MEDLKQELTDSKEWSMNKIKRIAFFAGGLAIANLVLAQNPYLQDYNSNNSANPYYEDYKSGQAKTPQKSGGGNYSSAQNKNDRERQSVTPPDFQNADQWAVVKVYPGEIFVNPKFIKVSNGIVRVWSYKNDEKPSLIGSLSTLKFEEFNCKIKKVRILSKTYYSHHSLKGKLFTDSENVGDWREFGDLLDKVCMSEAIVR